MSKSDKNKNRSRSHPATEKLNIIEIDETVVCRFSERTKKPDDIFSGFPGNINFIKVLDDGNFEVVFEKELLDDSENFETVEEFQNKIQLILDTEDIQVNEKNLLTYMEHLKKNLQFPCNLTGSEDFEWEEEYVIGGGSQKEYEKLKKTQPSYTDTFKFIKFNSCINEADGILVDVQRTTDRKKFTLPLSYLEAVDEDSPNYQLLDDYVVWVVNYM